MEHVDVTTIPDRTLTMGDLRPHLGRLNWQLRRIGMSICVLATNVEGVPSDKWVIDNVYLGPAHSWNATCDDCGTQYEINREVDPKCPNCGKLEEYDK